MLLFSVSGVLYVCLNEGNTASIPTPKWMSPFGPSSLTRTSGASPKSISLETAYSWLYENAVNLHNAVSTLVLKYVRVVESFKKEIIQINFRIFKLYVLFCLRF